MHRAAARTLAPSTPAAQDLTAHGVPRVHLWPRGVDSLRFHPRRRDEALHRALAPGGELLVGYVGRLAPEKRVDLLAGVCALPGVRLVVIGDGPSVPALKAALPGAVFLGRRTGEDWPAATPPWTSSCTPARWRRSARPSRRRWPAQCPWWRRPPVACSTWSATGAPGC